MPHLLRAGGQRLALHGTLTLTTEPNPDPEPNLELNPDLDPDQVGNSSPCVVTPCAHLFCKACLLHWMRAQNVMLSEAQRQGMSLTSKLCPCCRHPFTLSGLIEIVMPASGGITIAPQQHRMSTPSSSMHVPRIIR